MAIVYLGNAGGGSGGGVQDVTAADTSIVVGGTAAHPTVRTGTLDVIAADHPAAADWSNNSHKITSLANGTAASDAQAYGQGVASLLTAAGDTVYASAANTLARLPKGTDGQVLTLASGVPSWAASSRLVDYVAVNTATTTISGTSGAQTAIIDGNAVSFNGGDVWVEFFCFLAQVASTANLIIELWDGSTDLEKLAQFSNASVAYQAPIYVKVRVSLAAGTHTLHVKGWHSSGANPTLSAGGGGAVSAPPMWYSVTYV